MSRTTAPYVSGASVGLPGNMSNPVTPYASTGSTGTPSGSAASRARRSAMMLSVSSERYACCSVEPTGSTMRSSFRRYSSSCIQLRSRTRTRETLGRFERGQQLPETLRQIRAVVGMRLRGVVLPPDLCRVREQPGRDGHLERAAQVAVRRKRSPGCEVRLAERFGIHPRVVEREKRLEPRPQRKADARVAPVVDRDTVAAHEHIPLMQIVVLDRRRQSKCLELCTEREKPRRQSAQACDLGGLEAVVALEERLVELGGDRKGQGAQGPLPKNPARGGVPPPPPPVK